MSRFASLLVLGGRYTDIVLLVFGIVDLTNIYRDVVHTYTSKYSVKIIKYVFNKNGLTWPQSFLGT